MIEFECPKCKSSDIDFGEVSLDWLGNAHVIAWDECECNDCGAKFEIRTVFHARGFQYFVDDERGEMNEIAPMEVE